MPLRRTTLLPTAPPSAAQVWLAMYGELIEHVQRLTQQLTGGDFEALVIWHHVACAGEKTDPAAAHPRPLQLCDIAQATGIPRETVRRKLERLAAQGRVQRHGGGWVVMPAAGEDPSR